MEIHFVHTGNAYLPELQAYDEFIRSTGNQARIHKRIDTVPIDAKVVWWMCGLVTTGAQGRFTSAFHVHEYASASVGRLANAKDLLKRWVQPTPNYRIFQNEWVRTELGFSDSVPFEYRDMGISSSFFSKESPNSHLDFDFVYLGEMLRLKHFLPLFDGLARSHRSVLLVGQLPKSLERYFSDQPLVTAVGKMAYADVPAYLKRARYGLNLVPNLLPYTHQTSTKLLEYCASGLGVVSTDYSWVRQFESQHQGEFFFIPYGLQSDAYAQLLGPQLKSFACHTPSLDNLTWTKVIGSLKLWQTLSMYRSPSAH